MQENMSLSLNKDQIQKLIVSFEEFKFSTEVIVNVLSTLDIDTVKRFALLRKKIGEDVGKKRKKRDNDDDDNDELDKKKKQTIEDLVGFMPADILINILFTGFSLIELRYAVQYSKRIGKIAEENADSSLIILKKIITSGKNDLIALLREVLKTEFRYIYVFPKKLQELLDYFGEAVKWINGFLLVTKDITMNLLDKIKLYGKQFKILDDLTWRKFYPVAAPNQSINHGDGKVKSNDNLDDYTILASQVYNYLDKTLIIESIDLLPKSLKEITNLQVLIINSVDEVIIPKELKFLKVLKIRNSTKVVIPDTLAHLNELEIDAENIEIGKLKRLKRLDIKKAVINDLSLFKNLEEISFNKIKTEDSIDLIIESLPNLRSISLKGYKNLNSIELKDLEKLTHINIKENDITKVIISDDMNSLINIKLSGGSKEIILPNKMDNLEELSIDTDYPEIKFPEMPKLKKIKIIGGIYNKLELSPTLEKISIISNKGFEKLIFDDLSYLIKLSLEDLGSIKVLEFNKLPRLSNVYIYQLRNSQIDTIKITKINTSNMESFSSMENIKNVIFDDETKKSIGEYSPSFFWYYLGRSIKKSEVLFDTIEDKFNIKLKENEKKLIGTISPKVYDVFLVDLRHVYFHGYRYNRKDLESIVNKFNVIFEDINELTSTKLRIRKVFLGDHKDKSELGSLKKLEILFDELPISRQEEIAEEIEDSSYDVLTQFSDLISKGDNEMTDDEE